MTDRDDIPLAGDYTADDGWDDDNGLERCPHCEVVFSPNGGYFGTTYDQAGAEYETIYESDVADGPFFCDPCWAELERNRRRDENHTLGEFAGGGAGGDANA